MAALGICAAARPAPAQDLPRGQVIDDVRCAADPTQGYALYLPSTYDPAKSWPILMGFHPAARGKAIVDRYRAAAEAFGYIVAASNNSRNGAWEISMGAVNAMSADVSRRLSIDGTRVYLTGHSGGARVAMQVALGKSRVAGVIASSAAFPDGRATSSVPFAVFGTAGTEDFNYSEMRQLDRDLKSPHRVAIFDGGHTLPPEPVAMDALEWMELRAMATGLRPRDDAWLARVYDRRQQAASAVGESAAAVHLLQALAADFEGLRDVTAVRARATALAKLKPVKDALGRERRDDEAEERLLLQIATLEAGLRDDTRAADSLAQLQDQLARLWKQATAKTDSPEARRARRILRVLVSGASERVQDRQYLKVLEQYRVPPITAR